MVRGFFQKLMAGRYGSDHLNNALLIAYLILWLLSAIISWNIFYWIGLVLLIVVLFRCFSRKIDRRRAENARFLQLIRPLGSKVKNLRVRLKDREHRYFRCPNCRQQMRVPRGKGRITVHCRSCGTTFQEKS